jgi:hypothetical protein
VIGWVGDAKKSKAIPLRWAGGGVVPVAVFAEQTWPGAGIGVGRIEPLPSVANGSSNLLPMGQYKGCERRNMRLS